MKVYKADSDKLLQTVSGWTGHPAYGALSDAQRGPVSEDDFEFLYYTLNFCTENPPFHSVMHV